MRTGSLLLLLPAAALSLFTCSDRERLNPLDPLNPNTEGKPTGLNLASNRKVVSVTWYPVENRSVVGYKLFRYTPGEDDTALVATVASGSTGAQDTIPYYDTTYAYCLSAVTDSWESPKSDSKSIIPGPFNYWVADLYLGSLVRISYDGAHLLSKDFSFSPAAIDIDESRKTVWLANTFPGRIVRLGMAGKLELSTDLDALPVDIAVDQGTGEVFVAVLSSSNLMRLDADGVALDIIPCDIAVSYNSRLGLDPARKIAWVTVPDSNAVVKVNYESLTRKRFSGIRNPRTVSAMPDQGVTWIATDSGVVSIDENDNLSYHLPSLRINDLSVNLDESRVWLVAAQESTFAWGVYTIEPHAGGWLTTEFDIPPGGFATAIRVNPGTGYPGILLYDVTGNQIIRMNLEGNVLGMISGFSSRLDICVER